jgi:hypothetical protein
LAAAINCGVLRFNNTKLTILQKFNPYLTKEIIMSKKTIKYEPDFDTSKEQLIADFKIVVADAEALIKATANQGGEALTAVRKNLWPWPRKKW